MTPHDAGRFWVGRCRILIYTWRPLKEDARDRPVRRFRETPQVECKMQSNKTKMDDDALRDLLEADETEMSVVFSDPSLPDNPMIFVSDEFEAQTGYSPEEALGHNCRFLQGPETSEDAIQAIRHGLRAETRFTIDIVNYRKDGSPFLNRLRIRPIYDTDGQLIFFAGAQNPV
ncbi:MAG: PAS domain-containing protein [Roseovarius sp.]